MQRSRGWWYGLPMHGVEVEDKVVIAAVVIAVCAKHCKHKKKFHIFNNKYVSSILVPRNYMNYQF